MTIGRKRDKLKFFWRRIHEKLSALQEDQFDKSERDLIALMSENEKQRYIPVPTSLLMAMIWLFILLFPLLLLLDPSAIVEKNAMWRAMGMYYVTLLSTMFMFVINQRIFVPKYFFRKKYASYFIGNGLTLIFILFQREVVTFLTSRGPGEGFSVFWGSYCFSEARNHFSIWTIVMFLIILGAICFLCIMISMFSRQLIRAFITREKNKASLQYELDFLKNQLSPHFLFNTLNNITSLISFDPKLAESSMAKLSKLLRVMLYQTSDKFIELKDELDILQKYGELEKLRLSESFDFQFETKIENPHCLIPPLLMMPLMENAMKHCVNPDGLSFAHIRITQDEHRIHFRAENSNYPRKAKPGASGLGLATFAKRLELLYAERYSYITWTEGGTYVCDLVINL